MAKVIRDLTTINGQVMSVVYMTPGPNYTGGSSNGDRTTDSGQAQQTQQAQQSSPNRTLIPPATIAFSSSPTQTQESDPNQQQSSPSGYSQDPNQASTNSGSYPTDAPTTSAYNYNSSPITSGPATATYGTATASSTFASSDSSNSGTTTTSSTGLSLGAKAGIAGGVALLLGAILCIALVIMNKHKRRNREDEARQDSEKYVNNPSRTSPSSSPPNAPRLSLRPNSSFLPEFAGQKRKSRFSAGNMLTVIREPARRESPSPEIPLHEKSSPENPFTDPENPFADPVRGRTAPAPMPMASPQGFAPPAAVVTAAHAPVPISSQNINGMQRPDSRNDAPYNQRAVNEMPGSMTFPAPVASPSPTPGSGPVPEGNVYRILMDFVPSMEDELELRSGQVVRLLHEYDDGWCLCARLDRSQQGVVPRTCLAAKPSRPRPPPGANGPNGPRMNGPPPAQMRGPPPNEYHGPGYGSPRMAPPGAGSPYMGSPRQQQSSPRPMSPGAYNRAPRPLSPGPQVKRSQSPGPYGGQGRPEMAIQQRRRSNSASAGASAFRDRRMSPPGPSRLHTESVPGMAM